jgi:hypothetical protein
LISFRLGSNGNAENFLHGACVRPFVFLMEAEFWIGVSVPSRGSFAPGLR